MTTQWAKGHRVGAYRLVSRLGGGGNADAWRATGPAGDVAIKLLRRGGAEAYGRFRREVDQLRQLQGVTGVLPLLDAFLPEIPDRQNPAWLVMPIAELLGSVVSQESSSEEIVAALAAIADTLARLHGRGVSHRDIKPSNLYRLDGEWLVGDFGLVDAPDVDPLTDGAYNLGPRHYIAPEMILDPASADGAPADVYSLGKTMWVQLSGQRYPYPGEHRLDVPALGLVSYRADARLRSLEPLLESMTRHLPKDRPTMERVAAELRDWLAPSTTRTESKVDLSELARQADLAVSPHRVESERLAARKEQADRIMLEFSNRASRVADVCVGNHLPVFNQPYSNLPDLFNTDATEHLTEELSAFATRRVIGDDPPESRARGLLIRAHDRAPGLKLWIAVSSIPRHDPDVFLLVGASLVLWGGVRIKLWSEQERIVPRGPSETAAMNRLLNTMLRHLHDDVARWVQEIENRSDSARM